MAAQMWTTFDIEWKFITRLAASLPAAPDLQKKWLESRAPKVRPPDSKSIEEIAEEVAASTPEIAPEEERGFYVFQRQEGGLVLRMATIRAHLKDCARVLSSLYVGRIEKEKSFAVKVLNAVYYPPEVYWVPVLAADGEQVREPSGTYEKTIHVRTPQGERSAFKTMEYVSDALLRFQLQVLTQPPSEKQPKGRLVINEDDLNTLFSYGGVHGYGGERGDGEGRYVATVTRAG